MTKQRFTTAFAIQAAFLGFFAAQASFATEVEHDGRFIYYRTAWTQLTENEQINVVDASVALLKNELSQHISHVTGLKTLSNFLLTPKALDDLTAKAEQSVQIANQYSMRKAIPVAFMIYGGGSADMGLIFDLKGSLDLGLVVLPSKVTKVDTFTNESSTYYETAWSFVAVPHLYGGVGVGAGASNSVGVGLIWGSLDKVEDFHGFVAAGSADAIGILGADMEGAVVYNAGAHKSFFMMRGEMDWGAEFNVSLDGEGGYIQPLSTVLSLLGGNKTDATGTTDTPAPAGTPPVTPPSGK